MEALEAVLAAAGRYDHALVLGDLVGYGADPNDVVERVRSSRRRRSSAAITTRWPRAWPASSTSTIWRAFAIQWTTEALTPANLDWLAALPAGPVAVDDIVEICHGAPFDEDAYIFDDLDVRRALATAIRPLCLFGHTHVPAAFRMAGEMSAVGPPRGDRFRLALDNDARYLVNCGAVGQPRDGDPRAAFALLDTAARTLTIVRVPYDVARAQAKIISAGLPEVLAHRLAIGR